MANEKIKWIRELKQLSKFIAQKVNFYNRSELKTKRRVQYSQKFRDVQNSMAFTSLKKELLENFKHLSLLILSLEKQELQPVKSSQKTGTDDLYGTNHIDAACLQSEEMITQLIASKEHAFSETGYQLWHHDLSIYPAEIMERIDMVYKYLHAIIKCFEALKDDLQYLVLLDATDNKRATLYGHFHKTSVRNAKMYLLNAASHFYLLPVDDEDFSSVSGYLDLVHQL